MLALALVALSQALVAQMPTAPGSEAPGLPAPAPQATASRDGDATLVILVDAANVTVHVDGQRQAAPPLSLTGLAPGSHSIRMEAPGLPPFDVDAEVFLAGRTEVNAKIAQRRPAPDFSARKAAFDEAMFEGGSKVLASLCLCGLGGSALAVAGTTALVKETSATSVPLISTIAGGTGCLLGSGVCGWGALDLADSPEEPTIPRVHVIRIRPPTERAKEKVLEIPAPPADSDGNTLEGREADATTKPRDGTLGAAAY